jgi:hypothetical protein
MYQLDQLILGTIFFTLAIFLFPTILAFYMLTSTVSGEKNDCKKRWMVERSEREKFCKFSLVDTGRDCVDAWNHRHRVVVA